jgi:4-hydroxy-4-methyl-2-oxoglutarate aldolase
MPRSILLLALGCVAIPGLAQVWNWTPEEVVRWTPENPFSRSADGRPHVPDDLLERLRSVPVEVAWGVLRARGYERQHVGDLRVLHPDRRLVGRAVTAHYLPVRPDVAPVYQAVAVERGLPRGEVQKVIDVLTKGDVPVVDMMGAAPGHTFGGDNLHAAIYGRTGTGAVIHGRIRDLEGVAQLPTQVYYREAHPSAVAGVMLAGVNGPIRIGEVLVMPGDVVLGDQTGVIFIPPHLVVEVVEKADAAQIFDEWTVAKFLTGNYRSSELYGGPLSPELKAEFDAYAERRRAELKAARESGAALPPPVAPQ